MQNKFDLKFLIFQHCATNLIIILWPGINITLSGNLVWQTDSYARLLVYYRNTWHELTYTQNQEKEGQARGNKTHVG